MGNDQPGDGYLFRGRGMLQTTGRDAYTAFGKTLGHDLTKTPDDAFSAGWSLKLACAVWTAAGCNAAADQDDVKAVTRAINGGLIGLAGRTDWLRKAKAVWS
jgi:predicted chitinase